MSPKTEKKRHLLILDDDDAFRKILALEFEERGYTVCQCPDLDTIRLAFHSGLKFDFAILDVRLQREFGFHILKELLYFNPDCRALMLTGYPTTATTVESIRNGAVNYLLKPSNIELIEQALWLENVGNEFQFGDSDRECVTLERYEQELIEFVLAQCDWNITKAAQRLGLHRQSLQRKLRKYPSGGVL